MSIKRDVIRGAPTLLHTVALVAPTKAETIANIRKMDLAAPPSLYGPARQLFHAALQGAGYDWALRQAKLLPDGAERKCAVHVLRSLERYLRHLEPAWFRPLDIEPYQVSADLQIPVRVDGLMRVGDETRLVCLHPWERRLSMEQVRAAVGVLANRLLERSELVNTKLELLDLSVDPTVGVRLFRSIKWDTYSPMSPYELEAFMARLLDAWATYHASPAPRARPRPPRASSGQGDIFTPPPPEGEE